MFWILLKHILSLNSGNINLLILKITLAMAVPVLMPKQGQSVETCIITKWYKKSGEDVKKGEDIFSYETDKASFEQESPADGILLEIFYNEGDEVPVLTNVAVIGEKGENIDKFRPGTGTGKEEKIPDKKEDEIKETKILSETVEKIEKDDSSEVFITPRAKKLAEKLGVYYRNLKGSGPNNRITEKDIKAASASLPRMTVLASEKASESSLAPSGKASGIGGRILAGDLTEKEKAGRDFTDENITNIRRIIASNMLMSLQNSAQLTHHMSADARNILNMRKKIKKDLDDNKKIRNITINDMVCYAVIRALKKHPAINCHFMGEKIRMFNKVHLGFAVDTPRGLMVPVVRNADDLTISVLSSQMKNLAKQCKEGGIDPELLKSTAGSFTVSNLGAYDVEMFTPVLNLPQAGILGVNTIIRRPADLGNGIIGIIPYIGISLTYDHRAIDGGPASEFQKYIKEEIENINFEY
jgi:pyruvate dehydrogenase E2 component (dihydrolipoamide acetyltransferase)